MKNIMVWGGVHPNEPIGMAVADSLISDPIEGISAGIANPKARELNRRFVDTNLNLLFPGDTSSVAYEDRRAPEILAQSQGFDTVIDFHGANYSRTDFAVIHEQGIKPESLAMLGYVGIRKIVVGRYGTMLHDQIPDAFLLDIVEGGKLADVTLWRNVFKRYVEGPDFPSVSTDQFDWFETVDWQLSDGLDPDVLPNDLGDFSPIPARLLKDTPLPDDVHTMGNDPAKPSGDWPELCRPIAPVKLT